MIINLKRFKGNYGARLNTLVRFPVKGLDMSEFVVSQQKMPRGNTIQKPIYDLVAVSNHFGQSCDQGHYTAFTKNQKGWFHFNDHQVRECTSQDSIVSPAAYILFYVRRGIDFENLDYSTIQNNIEALQTAQVPKNGLVNLATVDPLTSCTSNKFTSCAQNDNSGLLSPTYTSTCMMGTVTEDNISDSASLQPNAKRPKTTADDSSY